MIYKTCELPEFNHGDTVYYVDAYHRVKAGYVDYTDDMSRIWFYNFVPNIKRTINGVGIQDFKDEFIPLPKNWKYSSIKHTIIEEKIDDSLVPETDYYWQLRAEQELNGNQWRTVVKLPMNPKPYYKWAYAWDCAHTYNEAKAIADAQIAEANRINALSDGDWSIETAMKYLNQFADVLPKPVEYYIDCIKQLVNIADVELKCTHILDESGKYHVYYHYFTPNVGIKPLVSNTHKRYSKAEIKKMQDETARKHKDKIRNEYVEIM